MQELVISAVKARSILLDLACLLHDDRAEIAELRAAGVSDSKVMVLYPFEVEAFYGRVQVLEADLEQAKRLRRLILPIRQFASAGRYFPVQQRKLLRSEQRKYDAAMDALRDESRRYRLSQEQIAEAGDVTEAGHELTLTILIAFCLTQQPYEVGRNFTELEAAALAAGLPLWEATVQELIAALPQMLTVAEAWQVHEADLFQRHSE